MKQSKSLFVITILIIGASFSYSTPLDQNENNNKMWRGIPIAPEQRCQEYNRKKDYPYSPSIENTIIASMGGKIYTPYTGKIFQNKKQTDIEHIVALSEAHDSGLCQQSDLTKKHFASDLLNLTLATPKTNRCSRIGKCHKDAAEWLPEKNTCWFAMKIIKVRLKYALTIDHKEAQALDRVLSGCNTTDLIYSHDITKP